MRRVLSVAIAAALALGSVAHADPAATGGKVAWVDRPGPPPLFLDRTSSGSVFVGGLVGFAVWTSTGHKEVVDDQIDDPAGPMARKIAEAYARQVGGEVVAAPINLPLGRKGADAKAIAAAAPDARYGVQVDSAEMGTVWASYMTWPIDLTHYIVHYASRATIVDLQSGKRVWEGGCDVYTKRGPDTPTHDQMYANQGAILKTMIAATVEQCLEKMKPPGMGSAPA